MSDSAEAVAANQSSRRNVTIELTNLTASYCLIDPKVYLESGGTHVPPQPTVRPLKIEVCNFTKSSGASGAVGVLTYDLLAKGHDDSMERLAIMFSVPYDNNMYQNWFSVGIYPRNKECDEALYNEMYYKDEDEKEPKCFVRGKSNGNGITYEGNNLDIKATMSPLGRAIMKVEIWDKLFSPPKGQQWH